VSLQNRALKQAARELLLAQASDWPFIIHTGTIPDYARDRLKNHLLNFNALYDQLTGPGVNEEQLARLENADNIFPEIDFRYWA
jgi:1,4-alpha-glucan branching enzyme